MKDPLTHRRILGIALPLVASNITVPLVGLADAGVVGQLPDSAALTGAVGLGAAILSMMYWMFGFLRMGTVGLTSQASGAEDTGEVSALFFRATGLGIVFGIALIILQIPAFWMAFTIAPATDQVEGFTHTYLSIRIWSAPAAIAIYGITGWLIGQERTRAVMLILTWINGMNILLDIVFVLQLDMGVAGVALATLIAEVTGLALGLWLCRDAFVGAAYKRLDHILDRAKLKAMAILNTDIMIRSLLLLIGFSSFTFIGSGFGEVTLAANTVLTQFVFVTAYAMDGFAFAAEALIGRFFGARNPAKVREAAIKTTMWGAIICTTLAVAFYIFGPEIIDRLNKDPAVQAEARVYLWWMILTPLIGWPAWMLDGIFIGATRSRDMRNMMVISFVVYVFLLLICVPTLGNTGLWLAITLFYVVRGVTLGARIPALIRAAAPADRVETL
ncbi:MAG: MATE family efflux transporter [Planktomarina sp.]